MILNKVEPFVFPLTPPHPLLITPILGRILQRRLTFHINQNNMIELFSRQFIQESETFNE